MSRARWPDVDSAVRECLQHTEALQAIDPAAHAERISWERPNPRKTPTVNSTGQGGSPARNDPLDAVARGRMRRLLDDLKAENPIMAACTVAACFGWVKPMARALGRRPSTCYSLADAGKELLQSRMRKVGLLEAA